MSSLLRFTCFAYAAVLMSFCPVKALVTSDGSIYLETFAGDAADDPLTNVIGAGAARYDEAGQIETEVATEGVVRAGTGLGITPSTEYVVEFDFAVNASSGDNFYALFGQGTAAPWRSDINLRVFSDGTGDWEVQVDHAPDSMLIDYTQTDLNFSFGQSVHFTVHHKANEANEIDLYFDDVLFGTFEDVNPEIDVDLIQWGDSSGGAGYGNATIDNISIGSPVISNTLPGDFNDDGMVNLADYTVWRDNLGNEASVLNGNGSGEETVVAADYNLWNSKFGVASPTALVAATVPEPASMGLLFVGAIVLAVRLSKNGIAHLAEHRS